MNLLQFGGTIEFVRRAQLRLSLQKTCKLRNLCIIDRVVLMEKEVNQVSMKITRTDLARRTREAVESAQRGETVFIESYGTEQAVLVDALEYHLLRAVAVYRSRSDAMAHDPFATPHGVTMEEVEGRVRAGGGDWQEAWDLVIARYLDGDISLGRAAELLDVSRFDLQLRFNRLGLPKQQGAFSVNEARTEYHMLSGDNG